MPNIEIIFDAAAWQIAHGSCVIVVCFHMALPLWLPLSVSTGLLIEKRSFSKGKAHLNGRLHKKRKLPPPYHGWHAATFFFILSLLNFDPPDSTAAAYLERTRQMLRGGGGKRSLSKRL